MSQRPMHIFIIIYFKLPTTFDGHYVKAKNGEPHEHITFQS